ncbi:TPA: DJ-1/PfpI family protein [Proteus mirabilis]
MKKVALILTPGFADWEYSLIAGTSVYYGVEVRFYSPMPGIFQSQGGLSVMVDGSLQQCLVWQPDVVVIIGGTIWETQNSPDLRQFLHACHHENAAIAGICGGTLALARAGLLNETAHTSNNPNFLLENAEGYIGNSHYRDSTVAVVSDGIITSPGSAPVSFTSAVFQMAGVPISNINQLKAMLAAEHL